MDRNQHGFHANKSTGSFTKDRFENGLKKEYTSSTFINHHKAFDTNDFEILLQK